MSSLEIVRRRSSTRIFRGKRSFVPRFPLFGLHNSHAPPRAPPSNRPAVEVTLPGGDPIPPFRPGYLKKYVRSQKARFGDVVFEIFATSQDQKELEEKIVAAYDETKRNIDRQTERVARAQAMADRGDEREEARLRDELSGE